MELPAHNNQTALLDSAVPGQSQKEIIVSAPQVFAVSACPIAQVCPRILANLSTF